MDSFETLMAMLLEREGYWVQNAFKGNLTKEEKRKIGRSSSPRWELDLVAYKGATNEVRIVECKSYLDSPGVRLSNFVSDGSRPQNFSRYKLFHEHVLFETVVKRLVSQLEAAGSCAPSPTVVLCLAAGKIKNEKDRLALRDLFSEKGWLLFDEPWIVQRVRDIAAGGYENNVAAVVAKLLERSPKPASKRAIGA